MSVIHAPKRPDFDAKSAVYLGTLAVAFVVFFLRLWYIQVAQAEEIVRRTETQRQASVPKLAPRGLIFDRNGELIAGVKAEIVLTAVPRVVQKNKWVIAKVAGMLGLPEKKLWDKVDDANWRPYLPTPIAIGVPIDIATRVAEAGDNLPGIGVESQPMRVYFDTVDFCHFLGYVWTPTDKDEKRLKGLGIEPADYVGKQGIEQQYESLLMGSPGKETVEIDAKGRPIRVVARDNAQAGAKLTLTVDAGLQELANQLLAGRKGGVVAIDPSTGEVLCLVSAPTYDTAQFIGGISQTDWEQLRDDESHPLINRATGSSYSPGSTFKIVDTLAAVSTGVFSESHSEFCPGYYQVGNRKWKCLGVHGTLGYYEAFARSCNAFFSSWAFKCGPEMLQKTARQAGLGAKTGIDLPSETSGTIPDADYYAKKSDPPRKWYGGDTVNMGIGQGETAASPLQMACLVSLVANGGVSYKPHLLRSYLSSDNGAHHVATPLEELARIDDAPWVWADLKRAMIGVIEHGTATNARIDGVVWGGKTGSAEHNKAEKTHSWFVGFAPADNPKIAIAVLVEAAGHGSTVAAPIARDLVKYYLTKSRASSTARANRTATASSSSSLALSPSE